ncbi:MAG: PEP-CTERM sorting domain-containing protein [Gammaproteobacteria bacterium]|nr:PEP-CTERM sorting domain-containing protein [Gammaproteobacteria bacterium]
MAPQKAGGFISLGLLFCCMLLLSLQAQGTPIKTFQVPPIGKIDINIYQPWASGSWSGVILKGGFQQNAAFKCPEGSCPTDFRWIQMIVTNEDSTTWSGEPPKIKDSGIDLNSKLWGETLDDYMKEMFYIYLDPWKGDPKYDSAPFYNNNGTELKGRNGYTYALEDAPKRFGDGVWYQNVKHPLAWAAELALVCTYDNKLTYLGSVLWGWERLGSAAPTANELRFTSTSSALKKLVQTGYPNYQVVADACCKVPEPATLLLMGFGLCILAARRIGTACGVRISVTK